MNQFLQFNLNLPGNKKKYTWRGFLNSWLSKEHPKVTPCIPPFPYSILCGCYTIWRPPAGLPHCHWGFPVSCPISIPIHPRALSFIVSSPYLSLSSCLLTFLHPSLLSHLTAWFPSIFPFLPLPLQTLLKGSPVYLPLCIMHNIFKKKVKFLLLIYSNRKRRLHRKSLLAAN